MRASFELLSLPGAQSGCTMCTGIARAPRGAMGRRTRLATSSGDRERKRGALARGRPLGAPVSRARGAAEARQGAGPSRGAARAPGRRDPRARARRRRRARNGPGRPRPRAEPTADDAAGAGAGLDAQAKAAYRARVEELREELEQARDWADDERAARAQEELDFIARELARAVGLGGRDRPTASPGRARAPERGTRGPQGRAPDRGGAAGARRASRARGQHGRVLLVSSRPRAGRSRCCPRRRRRARSRAAP